MRFTRQRPSERSRLSLRSRLLAGLITITALFLIVMGVVTTVVLSNIEQDQFNTDLRLTVRESVPEVADLPTGYAAAYINVASRSTGILSGSSGTATDLQNLLNSLLATRQATAFFLQNPPGTLFRITPPDDGPLTAVWRRVMVLPSSKHGLLPIGENILVVARPENAVGNQVRGLIVAEVITGAVLLALLALGGRWLIIRGLAPLDRIQQAFGARWASEQKVRQFAADASHELRTPLTTIRGYAELYRQGALGPDRLPNAMRRIEQEADRMSSLVAELLELARLDRNSSLDLTDTDMAELVRDAVADAKAVEPGRPVSATTPSRLIVVADEPRIRQVLANLHGNVREHTGPDTPVAVRLAPAGQGALLEVTDAGEGMSEDAAARAFDRFYRGGHNGHGRGSGLGLSIVQAIATAHGGHAMLKSSEGVGTSVQFWIPFRPPTQPDLDTDDPQRPGPDVAYN